MTIGLVISIFYFLKSLISRPDFDHRARRRRIPAQFHFLICVLLSFFAEELRFSLFPAQIVNRRENTNEYTKKTK